MSAQSIFQMHFLKKIFKKSFPLNTHMFCSYLNDQMGGRGSLQKRVFWAPQIWKLLGLVNSVKTPWKLLGTPWNCLSSRRSRRTCKMLLCCETQRYCIHTNFLLVNNSQVASSMTAWRIMSSKQTQLKQNLFRNLSIPVVPHKAVAEVSKIGNLYIGAVGCCESRKMHFPWQEQYKRHVHERCLDVRALISWEGLHFGASDL